MRTPKETHDAALAVGQAKVTVTRVGKGRLSVLSIAAGAYIALGGLLSVIVGGGMPEAAAANPALQKLLSAAVFPLGLFLIVVLGGELFTGNNALLMPGLVSKKFGWGDVAVNWIIVWVFNFVGALLFVFLFVWGTQVLHPEPWNTAVRNIAVAKTSMPWMVVFLKAAAANWCVCLAVWLALTGHNMVEKMIGCWLPVFAFVALGFEHCIANMFFIPAGMMEGADVGIGIMFTANLIPATLGNIVGGALLVGTLYAWIHRDRK